MSKKLKYTSVTNGESNETPVPAPLPATETKVSYVEQGIPSEEVAVPVTVPVLAPSNAPVSIALVDQNVTHPVPNSTSPNLQPVLCGAETPIGQRCKKLGQNCKCTLPAMHVTNETPHRAACGATWKSTGAASKSNKSKETNMSAKKQGNTSTKKVTAASTKAKAEQKPKVEAAKPLTHGQIVEAIGNAAKGLVNTATDKAIEFKDKTIELAGFYGEDPKRKMRVYTVYAKTQAKDDYFWTFVWRESAAGNGQWNASRFDRSKTVEGAQHAAEKRMTGWYNMKADAYGKFKIDA